MIDVGVETDRFLRAGQDLVLGTLRRDGSPQASPVWYLWTGTSFLISTTDRTAKWHNLHRDPRCSICVDEPETGRMVVAYGEAELVTEDVRRRTEPLVAKYYPGDPDATRAHMDRIFAGDRRVLIDVVPDQIVTRRLDA